MTCAISRKKTTIDRLWSETGGPGGTRTHDQRIMSRLMRLTSLHNIQQFQGVRADRTTMNNRSATTPLTLCRQRQPPCALTFALMGAGKQAQRRLTESPAARG